MSDQTAQFPVKTSNLPDKCPMTGANLQPCVGRKRVNSDKNQLMLTYENLQFFLFAISSSMFRFVIMRSWP